MLVRELSNWSACARFASRGRSHSQAVSRIGAAEDVEEVGMVIDSSGNWIILVPLGRTPVSWVVPVTWPRSRRA